MITQISALLIKCCSIQSKLSFFVNFERNNNYKEILQGKFQKLAKMIKLNQNATSSSIRRINLRRKKGAAGGRASNEL